MATEENKQRLFIYVQARVSSLNGYIGNLNVLKSPLENAFDTDPKGGKGRFWHPFDMGFKGGKGRL